jgi:DNA polymerase I
VLFFDCETWRILPGLVAPPLVCLSAADDVSPPRLLGAVDGLARVRKALESGEVLINHNISFDLAVCCAADPSLIPLVFQHYERGLVRCTEVRQKLLDIAAGRRQQNGGAFVFRTHRDRPGGQWQRAEYNLAALVKLYTGKDRSAEKKDPNSWRTRFSELDGLPVEQYPKAAVDYVLEDAGDARDVYFAQGGSADGSALVNEVEQVRADWCLQLMRCWGIRTDGAAVAELEQHVKSEHDVLKKRMVAEGLYQVKRCSPAEVQEGKAEFWGPDKKGRNTPYRYAKNMAAIRDRVAVAFQTQGQEPPMTEGGETRPPAIATDRDTLEQSGDALLEELGEGGPVSTVLKTFVPALKRGVDVPINAFYNVLVNSGRISCSDPNLLNPPRKQPVCASCGLSECHKSVIKCSCLCHRVGVRECVVAREGFVLCSVDYDCAELRSHAQVNVELFGLERVEMAKFFREHPDGDPHLDLAASILGITYEEAKRRKKAKDPQVTGVRQMCKAVNFGLPGGMGWERLRESARKGYGVIMTEAEARERKAQWLKRWPEMDLFFKFINQRLGAAGEMDVEQIHPQGKPHRVRGGVGYCDGCNTYFQGRTADGAKEALWRVMSECYVDHGTALYGSRPLIFLYDEIITEVPEDVAHAAAYRQAEIMREAMEMWLPDIPVRCAPALMRRWSKDAEAAFDAGGRLIPWEDAKVVKVA